MLPKGNVSKRHARLLYRDGRFIVTDLKSTNGTYVNGRKIAQATIVREGDKIYIGDFVLRIELGEGAGAGAGASAGPSSPTPSHDEPSGELAAPGRAGAPAAPPPLPGAPTAGPPPAANMQSPPIPQAPAAPAARPGRASSGDPRNQPEWRSASRDRPRPWAARADAACHGAALGAAAGPAAARPAAPAAGPSPAGPCPAGPSSAPARATASGATAAGAAGAGSARGPTAPDPAARGRSRPAPARHRGPALPLEHGTHRGAASLPRSGAAGYRPCSAAAGRAAAGRAAAGRAAAGRPAVGRVTRRADPVWRRRADASRPRRADAATTAGAHPAVPHRPRVARRAASVDPAARAAGEDHCAPARFAPLVPTGPVAPALAAVVTATFGAAAFERPLGGSERGSGRLVPGDRPPRRAQQADGARDGGHRHGAARLG